MQFQFSVCMYGTCGRIDNKADFDFDSLWDTWARVPSDRVELTAPKSEKHIFK